MYLEYSQIDKNDDYDKTIRIKNAGLYGGSDINHQRVYPESANYSSQFFAKHHIPTNIRPGNNEPDLNMFKYYNKELYNFKCYEMQ